MWQHVVPSFLKQEYTGIEEENILWERENLILCGGRSCRCR